MAASPERHRGFLAAPRGILKIRLLPHPFRGRKPLFSPLSVARCQCAPFGHVRRSRRYIGFLGFQDFHASAPRARMFWLVSVRYPTRSSVRAKR